MHFQCLYFSRSMVFLSRFHARIKYKVFSVPTTYYKRTEALILYGDESFVVLAVCLGIVPF